MVFKVPLWVPKNSAAMHRMVFWKKGSTDEVPHAATGAFTYGESEELNIPPPIRHWDDIVLAGGRRTFDLRCLKNCSTSDSRNFELLMILAPSEAGVLWPEELCVDGVQIFWGGVVVVV